MRSTCEAADRSLWLRRLVLFMVTMVMVVMLLMVAMLMVWAFWIFLVLPALLVAI